MDFSSVYRGYVIREKNIVEYFVGPTSEMYRVILRKDAVRFTKDEAIQYIENGMMIGVGTGSTVDFFIDALAGVKHKIEGAIPSSNATLEKLKSLRIPIYDLNSVNNLPLYIDGADEFNDYLSLTKGGGGALTREKIIAASAKQFICIADESKHVNVLGHFPLPIEVIPMARGYVARTIVALGGEPVYRADFVTDNGNIILDVYNLDIIEPIKMEHTLNNITGVVTNGIFADRGADRVLMGTADGVKTLLSKAAPSV